VRQRVEFQAGLATIVAQGELTAEELFTLYSELLRMDAGAAALWDLSSATLRGLAPESVRRLARRVVEAGKGVRSQGVKAAIVCGGPLDYAIARMLSASLSIEGYPVPVGVFMGSDEARAWLAGVGSKPGDLRVELRS
jgi:hypothetical protein